MIHPDVARGLALEASDRARDQIAERNRLNERIAHLEAALKNSEAQQDWIAQRLRDFVTNKAVDEWQEAMTQLADYIEARKAP